MRNLLMTSVFALTLAACGGSDNAPSSQPTTSTPAPADTSTPEVTPTPETQAEAPTETPDTADAAVETAEIDPRLASLPAPYNEADLTTGARIYRQCSTCHLLEKDAGNRVGPNLHDILDRPAGAVDSFNYSKAMQESGMTWTLEHLDKYLENPRAYIPGNRMSFAGLRRPNDRRDVIAYLLLESGSLDEAE